MVYLCQTCWELLLLCAKRDYEKHGFFLSLARQWPIIYFFKIISKWAWPKMWYFFYLFVNADFYSQLMMGFLKTKLNFRNHKQSGGVKNWWCNYHMSCTKKKKKKQVNFLWSCWIARTWPKFVRSSVLFLSSQRSLKHKRDLAFCFRETANAWKFSCSNFFFS